MNILAIETTGQEASVAIINNQGLVGEEISTQKLNHLQNLMPMVDKLLEKCRLTIDDLSLIAVSEGPGSFTGIRIGIASARALAQVLEIHTISVPTLKSFAYHLPDYKGIICPIFDARRNQVYGAAFQWGEDGSIQELVPGAAYDLEELLARLEETEPKAKDTSKEITFFGDGIDKYREEILAWQSSLHDAMHNSMQSSLHDAMHNSIQSSLEGPIQSSLEGSSLNDNIRVLFAEEDIMHQKASSVAKLAYEIYTTEGATKTYLELTPVYMRKSEAERKLEKNS